MSKIIQKFRENRKLRIVAYTIIGLYAVAGFFLTTVFLAIRLHLTNDPGAVDFNDRRFAELAKGSDSAGKGELNTSKITEEQLLYKINILRNYYPQNASWIFDAFLQSRDKELAGKMFDAVETYIPEQTTYKEKITHSANIFSAASAIRSDSNAYAWANSEEWHIFRQAVVKDKRLIDSVSRITGIGSRLIAAMLVGEQIRLFDSRREAFKKWVAPLKILVNETTLSLGVMGIKEETARKIEKYLTDNASVFYPGPEFEHMLDFSTPEVDKERFQRLTNSRNHTYPYLYCALYLQEIIHQWQRSGYDLTKRPEIMATLFNLGFEVSVPKPDPHVGGSRINIMGHQYTFGGLAYEFYYSGELCEAFPFLTIPANHR